MLFGYVDFKTFKKSMLSYVRGVKDIKQSDEEGNAQKFVQDNSGATIEEAYEDFNKVLAEPVDGPNCQWKCKVNMKEYKDGWKLMVYQKKQQGLPDMVKCHASFKGITKE